MGHAISTDDRDLEMLQGVPKIENTNADQDLPACQIDSKDNILTETFEDNEVSEDPNDITAQETLTEDGEMLAVTTEINQEESTDADTALLEEPISPDIKPLELQLPPELYRPASTSGDPEEGETF